MQNQIIPFDFQDSVIRAVSIEGEPHLVAKDVATALGYSNTNEAIDRHCRGVAKRYPIVDSLGRTQEARVIAESDVMRLIVSSKLPAAIEFERKVFEEVLPSIRKTGGYGRMVLTDEEIVHRALQITSERVRLLEAKVEADAPKVIFADAVAASHTSILVGELAKILRGNGLEIGQNRLFERLREDGYLIRRKGSDWNMPTQYSMEMGLFEIKETAITHSDGHVTVSKTPKVTGRGQQFFINKYAKEAAA